MRCLWLCTVLLYVYHSTLGVVTAMLLGNEVYVVIVDHHKRVALYFCPLSVDPCQQVQ